MTIESRIKAAVQEIKEENVKTARSQVFGQCIGEMKSGGNSGMPKSNKKKYEVEHKHSEGEQFLHSLNNKPQPKL
jgi:hypothetical protein